MANQLIPGLRTFAVGEKPPATAAAAANTTKPSVSLSPSPPTEILPQHKPSVMSTGTAGVAPARVRNSIRGERHMFMSSDDNALTKQILETHAPDGREVEVEPLLHIIEEIMRRAAPALPGIVHGAQTQAHLDALEDTVPHVGYNDTLDLMAYSINKISTEIACKCGLGGDAHSIAVHLLHSVSNYSWEAKVAIALAAFSINYGEFWLVAQLYPSNPLAKSIAILKELPELMERAEALKPKFDAVINLIKAMLDVTKSIIEFHRLFHHYGGVDTVEISIATAHIPTAVYWTIRSIVACSTLLMNLIAVGHEYAAATAEAWELSSLAHKLASIHEHLKKELSFCYQKIEEKRQRDAYHALVRLFDTVHIDNMKISKALIYAKEDQLPLFDGTLKKRTGIDVLRRKHVLLLVSDLDISPEELSILHQVYSEARQNPTRPESHYEVVWLPCIDRSISSADSLQKQFELVQNSMPWYSVALLSLIDPVVTKYIREHWKFNKKPMLVVLDPQGKQSNSNALHMMCIWGSLAFPFTQAREETLWKEQTWSIELLADSVHPNIFSWINDGKYICLYGGEDMDWIKRFTTTAKGVANAAGIPLEMLYVGKSNPKERVRKNNAIIKTESLSHVLPDPTLIWFFWMRLESMWHSKVQHGRSVENDPIMQEIMAILSYDGSDEGWAVFSRGMAEMTKGKGKMMLQVLSSYDPHWKDNMTDANAFVTALDQQLRELHTRQHCTRLILPSTTGYIPEKVVCAECSRPMERFIMFNCCID